MSVQYQIACPRSNALVKAGGLKTISLCLLEPRLKLLLAHLQVLGVVRSNRETLLDFWLETGRASLT
jgi:hypothetical protein